MTPNDIIDGLIVREGDAYTNRAADRGGPTKYGVTQVTLSEWLGRPATIQDVQNLTEHEAREIYRERYINKPGFLGIENDAVRSLVVDCAVNHGVKRAVILLQRAAKVLPDGILGPNTREAVNRLTAAVLYRRLCAIRVRFYGEIITKNPSQAVFASGWMNRVAEFIEESP